ncbi:MAG: methionyl-tRNA formyltransferase [Nitrospirales bacterium]|nr:methionyl-tRNA formyltransferase [Nitrospirales bacterium]
MNVVFMGTPDFAVPTLRRLVDSPFRVTGVVCQPDRPQGRGQKIRSGPVKTLAVASRISVVQPLKMKDPAFLEILQGWNPEVIVVAAFGRILPSQILQLPHRGCLNVHGSLLPKYRGAGPIQWAVINGERQTGITIMKMDEGMDTGAILSQEVVAIGPEETSGELGIRMAEVGGALLLRTLREWVDGRVSPRPQNDQEATLAPLLNKEDGLLDWTLSAYALACRIRGLSPWPGAYTFFQGSRLAIWKAEESGLGPEVGLETDDPSIKPGTITSVTKHGLFVKTGKGLLSILELQPANKKRMPVDQFLAGHPVKAGIIFSGKLV